MSGIYILDFGYGLPFSIIDSESLHLSGPHWYGFVQQFSTRVSQVKSKEVLVAGVQSEAEVEQRETSLLHLIQQPQTRVLKEDLVASRTRRWNLAGEQ